MRRFLLVLAGCGRIDFDGGASFDAPSLAVDTPFGPAVPIAEVNSAEGEDDPSMTDDGLELFFATDRNTGSERLWHSSRPSVDATWSAPEPVVELNAGGNVNNPKVTGDGLAIYFTSNSRLPQAGGADLWFATRTVRDATWGAPVHVPGLESAMNEYEPWALPDQRTIYFTFNAGSDPNLFRATRGWAADSFGTVIEMTDLTSIEYDGGMWVDASERVVLFHRDATPDRSVFRSFRASTSEPFSTPMPIAEIEIPGGVEEDPWMSPDGHVLLFASDAGGDYNLYMATR